MKRIFIVGSPRSGTTLLQSMLGTHPLIHTFPETHFFTYLLSGRSRIKTWLHLGNYQQAILRVKKFLKEADADEYYQEVKVKFNKKSITNYTSTFLQLLDKITKKKRNKNIWVEKTPFHLYSIETIKKACVPSDAYFVHIIRNGVDVIASMHEITKNHPELWGGERSIDECVNRWKNDIKEHEKYIGRKNHYFIMYDKIVKQPAIEIQGLCQYLGIDFEKKMISSYQEVGAQVSLKNETWKDGLSKGLASTSGKRAKNLFTVAELDQIKNSINHINLNVFDESTNSSQ